MGLTISFHQKKLLWKYKERLDKLKNLKRFVRFSCQCLNEFFSKPLFFILLHLASSEFKVERFFNVVSWILFMLFLFCNKLGRTVWLLVAFVPNLLVLHLRRSLQRMMLGWFCLSSVTLGISSWPCSESSFMLIVLHDTYSLRFKMPFGFVKEGACFLFLILYVALESFFFFFFFFGGTWVWTQCFMLAKQVPYCMSHTSSHFALVILKTGFTVCLP
jgi:hypothetical protein